MMVSLNVYKEYMQKKLFEKYNELIKHLLASTLTIDKYLNNQSKN